MISLDGFIGICLNSFLITFIESKIPESIISCAVALSIFHYFTASRINKSLPWVVRVYFQVILFTLLYIIPMYLSKIVIDCTEDDSKIVDLEPATSITVISLILLFSEYLRVSSINLRLILWSGLLFFIVPVTVESCLGFTFGSLWFIFTPISLVTNVLLSVVGNR
jgi:hypothetical protein